MNVSQAEKIARFKALHELNEPFLIANPFDVGTALMLEHIGFQAIASTSGGYAWSIGRVDGEVSLAEKLDHCAQISTRTSIPFSVDLGVGFGIEPNAVRDTVRQVAATGIAGCSIEDATVADRRIFDQGLAVERIQAAREGLDSVQEGVVLTARCEYLSYGQADLATTIERLNMYAEAGADVLYAPGVMSLVDIETLCRSVDKPVNVLVGFKGMSLSFKELGEAGVRRVSVGTQLAKYAYGSFLEAAQQIHKQGQTQLGGGIRSKDISRSILGQVRD